MGNASRIQPGECGGLTLPLDDLADQVHDALVARGESLESVLSVLREERERIIDGLVLPEPVAHSPEDALYGMFADCDLLTDLETEHREEVNSQ